MPRAGLNILLTKANGEPNGNAIRVIEDMAAQNKTQATIAAAFRMSKKQFETLLQTKKGENEYRLAWERGRARHEQQHVDHFNSLALGEETVSEEPLINENGTAVMEWVVDTDEDGKPIKNPDGSVKMVEQQKTQLTKLRVVSKAGVIAGIFYAKTQLGWKEARDSGPAQGQGGGVTIYLPGSLSKEDYYKSLGQTRPIDTRKGETLEDVAYKVIDDGKPQALPPPNDGDEE